MYPKPSRYENDIVEIAVIRPRYKYDLVGVFYTSSSFYGGLSYPISIIYSSLVFLMLSGKGGMRLTEPGL
jgi:hypothetical protein